jgi:hypothetical protein
VEKLKQQHAQQLKKLTQEHKKTLHELKKQTRENANARIKDIMNKTFFALKEKFDEDEQYDGMLC